MLTGWRLEILDVSSWIQSIFGVRFWAEAILWIEWRCCSSVRRCVMFCLSSSKRTDVYTGMCCQTESVWAAWVCSWGIVSGMTRGISAASTDSYFALSVSLHWSSISSSGGLMMRFPCQLKMDHWVVQTCFLCCVNLAPSMLSFSANCVKTAVETCSLIVSTENGSSFLAASASPTSTA